MQQGKRCVQLWEEKVSKLKCLHVEKSKDFTYAGPSSGSLIDPTKDSWLVLNKWPITERITTPKADKTVQNQALPDCKIKTKMS